MDLDKLKKDWQETSVKPTINEEKIGQMIDNEGQSAYAKLIWYSKLSMIVFPLISLFSIFNLFKYDVLNILYFVVCFIGFGWEYYKYRLLKSVDMLEMNILDISRFYIKYRKYVIYEIIASMVLFFTFVIILGYMEYIHVWSIEGNMSSRLPILIIIFSVTFIIATVISWKLYWKKVQLLGNSIREVKEFTHDNI